MFSKELINRLHIVQNLQENLIKEYGYEDYNVFIFGSFLTERFIEGSSDIDLAVYTKNFSKYIEIADYILDYMKQYNVKVDIFYIDINTVAPIYCAPLESEARITSYYPNCLNVFYNKCKNIYDMCLEEAL